MHYKIIDLGGSFIKIYDSETKIIIKEKNITNNIIELNSYKKKIIDIAQNIDVLYLSSQMHGIVIFHNNEKKFITLRHKSKYNIFVNKLFDDFKKITGLEKRLDLPISYVYEYILDNNIKDDIIILKNITEAILDNSKNITHISMAGGTGFFNISTKEYCKKYIDFFEINFNVKLCFDDVIFEHKISGKINNIDTYVGIGDFQASVNSFDINENDLVINMATGSQVAQITNCIDSDVFSYRNYFNNKYVKCITHIPSGRFLNIFYNFFIELNLDIFMYINNLNLDDIYTYNKLNITTDIFDDNGIEINNININNFNIKNLCCSFLSSYAFQYVNLIKKNNIKFNRILLSGGIAKKINLIKNIFEKEFNVNVLINDIDDDSIYGIINLI